MTNPFGSYRSDSCEQLVRIAPHGAISARIRVWRWIALALGGTGAASAAIAQEAPGASSASGNDVAQPIQRMDLRGEISSKEDSDEFTTTLRYARPQPIGGGWTVNLRADLPVVRNDEVTTDNPNGDHHFGLGDVLVQAVFVRHTSETEGLGIGAQLLAPTASEEGLGKGKWRLRPTAGYRWMLPEISEKTFFQLLARYDFSFAGDKARANVSELQFAPNLEFGLPGDAYFSIFPSTDIRYNFERKTFFLPVDLEVGKEWGRFVASVEGAAGIISGNSPPYDWKAEVRIGYRF